MKNSKQTFKRIIAVALAGVSALSLASCGGNDNATGGKLKYWVRLSGNIATSVTNYAETPLGQELSKRTGIEIEYIHPAQGQEKEALNLLLASGNLPDIIETDWLSRNPESMLDKKTIINLNDVIANNAPNLKAYLDANPDVDTMIKTDNGNYYAFPFVRDGGKLLNVSGFMLRDDWMQELGLEYPETIDEWENVLTAFKEKKGATTPYIGTMGEMNWFANAFDATPGFYVDNGTVKYGVMQEGFGEFLKTMNQWYNKGLIDKNFATVDTKYKNSCVLDEKAGAVFGSGGSGLGAWITSAKANGIDGFSLKAVRYPVKNKGDLPKFTNREWRYSQLNGAAITSNCKNVELAAKFLDYSYSEEGAMLNNFGIEGESYTMVDGNPVYTEKITNNPDGLPMSQVLSMYVRSSTEGPFIQDERYISQYYQLQEQRDALDVWGQNVSQDWKMPMVTLTSEEQAEYSRIITDFQTFQTENVTAFIMGSRPISEFETFVQECKDRDIERAIEIYQAAYDRYINRK